MSDRPEGDNAQSSPRVVAQITAHFAGTILLLVFITATYTVGFKEMDLVVLGIFVALEAAVLVLSGIAAMMALGSISVIGGLLVAALSQSDPPKVERQPREAGAFLVATAILTVASLTFLAATTGGLTVSPFLPFLLIALVFGQETARLPSSIWWTLLLGLAAMVLLTFLEYGDVIGPPGGIAPWVYLASAAANLVYASAVSSVRRLHSPERRAV